MLYMGMLFSPFAWHVEDNRLYSINQNHLGADKTWYAVGAEHAAAFEKVVQDTVFDGPGEPLTETEVQTILIGKAAMFSPRVS